MPFRGYDYNRKLQEVHCLSLVFPYEILFQNFEWILTITFINNKFNLKLGSLWFYKQVFSEP